MCFFTKDAYYSCIYKSEIYSLQTTPEFIFIMNIYFVFINSFHVELCIQDVKHTKMVCVKFVSGIRKIVIKYMHTQKDLDADKSSNSLKAITGSRKCSN